MDSSDGDNANDDGKMYNTTTERLCYSCRSSTDDVGNDDGLDILSDQWYKGKVRVQQQVLDMVVVVHRTDG